MLESMNLKVFSNLKASMILCCDGTICVCTFECLFLLFCRQVATFHCLSDPLLKHKLSQPVLERYIFFGIKSRIVS